MRIRPIPRRARRGFALAVLAAALVPSAPAWAADPPPIGVDTIQGAYAGPITPQSACTADLKAPWNENTTFDPSKPYDYGTNNPSIEDLIPDRRAGAVTDYCVAFRMGTNLHPALTTPRFGSATKPLGPGAPAHQSAFDVAPTIENGVQVPGTGDDLEGTVIDLPRGYVGAPAAVPTCSTADFAVDNPNTAECAEATQVGDAVVRIQLVFFDQGEINPEPGELTFDGSAIYNLDPGPGEVGRLGVSVQPLDTIGAAKFIVKLVLTPDGSGRIRTITEQLPRVVAYDWDVTTGKILEGWRIRVESVGLKIWGSKAAHPTLEGDFSQNSTSCTEPQQADFAVETYEGTSSTLQTPPHTLTGCDEVPFAPAIDIETTAKTPATPTGVRVKLRVPQDVGPGGRLPGLLRDAAVTLPEGLELGAQAAADADGLAFCAPERFGAAAPSAPSACPGGTKAGNVQITSPLIDAPFTGTVFLGTPRAGQTLPELYVEASLKGDPSPNAARIKLVGETTVDDRGRITATFKDAPQLRFSEFTLDFPGGPGALFSTPQRCGTTTSRSQLLSYARTTPTPVETSLTIDQGCGAPFAPTLSVEPADAQAGRKSATKIVMTRAPSAPWISRVAVRLPSGLLADLNSAAECDAESAKTGACPAASRIGTLRVRAGAGDQPLPLEGAVYLTARQPGDVAGAVLVTRAKIGDLDLGDVVVPGRIALRPTDAGLTFTADVPTRHKGLALQLQRIEVDLDRTAFALNPSACGPLPYGAELTGDHGEAASPEGAVSYTGCGNLSFAPKLRATLTGDNTPGGHPGMYVELTSPEGDSAMRTADVTLPKGVAAALPNVQNPCAREQFDAGACPASTRVGSATAYVSIAPDAITGDIFLVRVPGKSLPGLGLNFTGRYAQRVLSAVQVNKDGRLVTSFAEIPDLPLRKLVIDVASGPKSPLQLPKGSCASGSGWTGAFTAQGGQRATSDTGLQCAAPAEVRLNDKRGLTVRLFDLGARKLVSAKTTLPKGWAFNPTAAKRRSTNWVRMTGASSSLRVTRRAVTVQRKKGAATDVRVKVSGAAVRPATRAAKRAKNAVVPIRLAFTDGTVQTQEVPVTLR